MTPMTGAGLGSLTTTVKLRTALRGGLPLSVTRTVMRLVLGAWPSTGVHWKTPLLLLITAPSGAVSRLNVRLCGGLSVSVALMVRLNDWPRFNCWSGTGPMLGWVLDPPSTTLGPRG